MVVEFGITDAQVSVVIFTLVIKVLIVLLSSFTGFSLSNTAKLSRLFKDSVAYLMTRQLRESEFINLFYGFLGFRST